jgi:hypothetical protein
MTARITHPSATSALSGLHPSRPTLPHGAAPHSRRWRRLGAGRWAELPALLAAVAGVVLFLLIFGWQVLRAAPGPVPITPEGYERVKQGMGREEVEAAVGLPPGDYRDGDHQPGGRWYTEWSEEAGNEEFNDGDTAGRLTWEGNAYSVVVGFDDAGAVQWKTLWKHVPPTPRGPVEKALAWLHI